MKIYKITHDGVDFNAECIVLAKDENHARELFHNEIKARHVSLSILSIIEVSNKIADILYFDMGTYG